MGVSREAAVLFDTRSSHDDVAVIPTIPIGCAVLTVCEKLLVSCLLHVIGVPTIQAQQLSFGV